MVSLVKRIPFTVRYVQNVGHPTLLQVTTSHSSGHEDIRFVFKPPQAYESRVAEVAIYRNMVRVSVNGKQPPQLAGTKRGQIALEFTGKPRKRMLDCLNTWRVPFVNLLFLHLTYPAEYPLDWRIWKLDLKRFKAALLRKWPSAQGVWKLELQRRGAPHFHILLDTSKPVDIRRMRQWVDACWARIAHQHDQYEGKYACRVEMCWSIRHAMNYAGKYMTKPGQNPVDSDGVILEASDLYDTMGRLWGKIGELNCEPDTILRVPVESIDYYRLQCAKDLKRRGARGWYGLAYPIAPGSFSVYGLGYASDDRFLNAVEQFENWEVELFKIGDLKQWRLSALTMVNAMQFVPSYRTTKKQDLLSRGTMS